MKYRTMGVSGLRVSIIALGTMNFANKYWGCDEKESFEIIDSFIYNGGNFIDTANYYSDGESEKILGKALGKGRRDKLIISTKCGVPLINATINMRGSSRFNIIKAVEDSLIRLNTDYIDLLYLHMWDPMTPLSETLMALTDLVRQGKVRYLGASNFAGWQISEASSFWKNNSYIEPLISIQSEYSLIRRYVEYEIIPSCIYNKIGFVCYSPLGGGVLSGIYNRNKNWPKNERYTSNDWWSQTESDRYLSEKNLKIVDEVKEIAVNLGVSLPALSLSWCIHKPAVIAVLLGAKNVSQVIENIKAVDIEINNDIMQKLDIISNPFRPYEYGGLECYLKDIFGVIDENKNFYIAQIDNQKLRN